MLREEAVSAAPDYEKMAKDWIEAAMGSYVLGDDGYASLTALLKRVAREARTIESNEWAKAALFRASRGSLGPMGGTKA